MFMKFYLIAVKFVVYHFVIWYWAVFGNEHKIFLFSECAYVCVCVYSLYFILGHHVFFLKVIKFIFKAPRSKTSIHKLYYNHGYNIRTFQCLKIERRWYL